MVIPGKLKNQHNVYLHSVHHANRVRTHMTGEFPLKGFEFSLWKQDLDNKLQIWMKSVTVFE